MDEIILPVELTPAIVEALDRGATVITGNQRAARTLRHAYDRTQLAKGLTAWEPADVQAWDSWTAELWQIMLLEGNTTSILLNRTQELFIWRSILTEDPETQKILRSVDSLAQMTSEAWWLVHQYGASNHLNRLATNYETRCYLRWANDFERRCQRHKCLSSARLEAGLQAAFQTSKLGLSNSIVLTGFDDLTPAQSNLIRSIAATGISVEETPQDSEAETRVVVWSADEAQEIYAAARWARNQLQDAPAVKIAVIVPSLENKRPAIDRAFRYVLAPELEDISAPNQAAPYEFSIGTRLADTPLVRVALDLLRWASMPLPLDRVSTLLVSPLFAHATGEEDARAIFDAFSVRQAKFLLRPEVTIRWVIETSSHAKKRTVPAGLIAALHRIDRAASAFDLANARRAFGAWADVMRALMLDAQCGRNGGEDSVEFQTRRRWEAALDELEALDFAGMRVNFEEALNTLVRITQSVFFAPESREAPVQILGPLEAAGSRFDAIWFMGAGDLTWPTPDASNPLLPWALQAELGMPSGDIAKDASRNLRVARRIVSSAVTAIFSYASEIKAGRQRPSPFLNHLNLSDVAIASLSPDDIDNPPTSLEEVSETLALPLLPDQTIRGGAEILSLQAACGFRAFAEKRLLSAELKSSALGMDAAERGTIVHRTLEALWNDIRSQAALKQMTDGERSSAIQRAIAQGMSRLAKHSISAWDTAYVAVQRDRLHALLSTWLDVEFGRQPFEVKLSEKEFKDVKIGPLQLTVRVDRVDSTEKGDVIVDYKTRRATPAEWLSPRPDEPQLPLYAVLASSQDPTMKLADVAFANVRAGKDAVFDSFQGKVSVEKSKPNTRRPPLDEQLEEWKVTLARLAADFYHGDARVDPKKYPTTCKYCAQRTLCRLNPALIEVDEELDEQTEND
jgi:probable DNA repair protein